MHGVARVGHNCWAVSRATRLAFLIDADAYFRQLVAAVENATRSVLIAGWDIHSQVRLRRDRDFPPLGEWLNQLARRRPHLRIDLLIWDYSVLCAASREELQGVRLGWKTPDNVRFHADDRHALGACHHEKVVVIDDELVFVGGIDLTARRWDTRGHEEEDSRRVDPDGEEYPPFHDVQLALSGPVASELGDAIRERWARATGERVESPSAGSDPWPESLDPDLSGIAVGLSRTSAAHDDRPGLRQIESLYLDALKQARRHVYIENQYLSADGICRALIESLQRDPGPEVCIVVPRRVDGWLEESVMGNLRARFVHQLRAADEHDRLRLWFPRRGNRTVRVHSKVCIIDDRFVTVGSANLSNRSLGLDTECNVFVDASGDADARQEIGTLLDRLLADHLACDAERIAAERRETNSLHRTVETFRGGKDTLEPLPQEEPDESVMRMAAEQLLDPERPISWPDFLKRFVAD